LEQLSKYYNQRSSKQHDDAGSRSNALEDHHVIHAAVQARITVENLQQLLSDYPTNSCCKRDFFNFGVLPLHIAVTPHNDASAGEENDQDVARVKCILSAYPLGAKHLDLRGRLPLHHALLQRAEAEVIMLLIKTNPISLSLPFVPTKLETSDDVRSMTGFLPFHLSCCLDLSISVIFELIQSNPCCISIN